MGRLGDDLDPVGECHTENEFWQLAVTVETAPAFLRALDPTIVIHSTRSTFTTLRLEVQIGGFILQFVSVLAGDHVVQCRRGSDRG